MEDWSNVDFETVFPTLIFQGGRFDSFSEEGWNRLCAALVGREGPVQIDSAGHGRWLATDAGLPL